MKLKMRAGENLFGAMDYAVYEMLGINKNSKVLTKAL